MKFSGKKVAAGLSVPTKTQLSNFLGTPGEDYFKGNPKSLNFYFLVIWWGKLCICISKIDFILSEAKKIWKMHLKVYFAKRVVLLRRNFRYLSYNNAHETSIQVSVKTKHSKVSYP